MKTIISFLLLALVATTAPVFGAQNSPLDEVRSQATHSVIGFIPTFLLGPIGIPVVALWVYSQENEQHPGECNAGCTRDVFFYTLGAAMGVAAH